MKFVCVPLFVGHGGLGATPRLSFQDGIEIRLEFRLSGLYKCLQYPALANKPGLECGLILSLSRVIYRVTLT